MILFLFFIQMRVGESKIFLAYYYWRLQRIINKQIRLTCAHGAYYGREEKEGQKNSL